MAQENDPRHMTQSHFNSSVSLSNKYFFFKNTQLCNNNNRPNQVCLAFGDQVVKPGGRDNAVWRLRRRMAAKTATPALVVATRAAERRNGPVRSPAQKTGTAEAAQNAPRRPTTSVARGPELFQLYEEEPGGRGPAPLPEVAGPQERVQRRTMEQLADLAPLVQILDDPVPPIVGQLVLLMCPRCHKTGSLSALWTVIGGAVGGSAHCRVSVLLLTGRGAER